MAPFDRQADPRLRGPRSGAARAGRRARGRGPSFQRPDARDGPQEGPLQRQQHGPLARPHRQGASALLMAKKKRSWPTPAEARSALYIDFEGRTGKPPVLLGRTRKSKVKHVGSVKQVITDESLRPLGEAEGLEVMSLSDAVESILMQAEKKQRLIVAWSNHELNVVERDCPEHLERLRARYVNARTLIVHWRNARHGGHKAGHEHPVGISRVSGLPGAGWRRSWPGGQDDQVVARRLRQGSSCGPADREPARPMGSVDRPQRPRLCRHASDPGQGRRRDGWFLRRTSEIVGYTSEWNPLNPAGSIVLTPDMPLVMSRPSRSNRQSPRRHASWASCVLDLIDWTSSDGPEDDCAELQLDTP